MTIRRKGWLLVGPLILGFAAFAYALSGRSQEDPCSGLDAVLATVAGVALTNGDLEWSTTQGKISGSRLTREEALRDLTWQEQQRQAQGLPGGPEARQSRRRAITGYIKGRGEGLPPLPLTELPDKTELTECGRRVGSGSEVR